MSDAVIRVENLGKKYQLGVAAAGRNGAPYRTLREDLMSGAQRLFRRQATSTSGEFWALKDVTFEIRQGEAIGIIGRNGAGKSTLLKILSRITDPSTGRARIRGRVASLLEVGTGFHQELTGRENIFLNGAILGMSRQEIKAKFDEIIAFAEIERFLDTPVKRYSSGMYVRLAFAVAAHLEPEILIVDEVLAVGDVAFQKKCLGKMQSVAETQGRTVLFVSHNLHAVRRLCARAMLLEAGFVRGYGETPRILDLYTSISEAAGATAVPSPPADLLDRGYITAVAVESADGRASPMFSVGEDWRVRVNFRLLRAMEHFVIGVGFIDSEGVPVQTAWAAPINLEPGDYEATFNQTSVRFAAGGYTVIVGLNERDQTFQQIQATRVNITGEDAAGYYPITSGAGLVLNSMQMAIRRV